MGDSLTAGNGILASNIIGDLVEYRGHSWWRDFKFPIFNDIPVLVKFDIIKQFGSYLYGYSLGTGGVDSPGARLNVAHPGDTSHNMPQQARTIIDRMRSDNHVRYNDDWKLITLFVGGNDLCDACNDLNKYSAANYVTQIRMALDILHSEVPKAFINVVNIFDIAPIASMNGGIMCTLVHS
ncbi:hypothetical protein KUTeg_008195 [Tegillarca granosa]|uniref:Phospholipase B1, membrane-associated n=1 Tax=Tegillarca granosa TaxID=220873 RepID=A0ABQ9F8H4_TEGGR|nr:hypothetical protein KUTeg_008195 [Tegillarca granosa]